MSGKPDDIPQAVWDAALQWWRRDGCSVSTPENYARAILAESERCAALVDAERARILSKQDGKDTSIDANLRLIAVVLPELSAAIRRERA